MLTRDWSSDVCSSDLTQDPREGPSLAGRTTRSFLRHDLIRLAREEARDQGRVPHEVPMTQAMTTKGARRAPAAQCPPFLFGAKGASAGESIKQRHLFQCNETKTSPTARRKSLWSPSQRHHQSLWQARTNFSQDKCTRCSPSKWPIVGALPAHYLGRGPGPL